MAWPYKEVTHQKRVFAPLDRPAEPLPRYGYRADGDRWTVIENATGNRISSLEFMSDAAMDAARLNRDAS